METIEHLIIQKIINRQLELIKYYTEKMIDGMTVSDVLEYRNKIRTRKEFIAELEDMQEKTRIGKG